MSSLNFFVAIIICLTSLSSEAQFLSLFKQQKPLIAALMVDTDLSKPNALSKNRQWIIEQSKIAESEGMDGILVEFRGGGIQDPKLSLEKMNYMTDILKSVVASTKMVVGTEILWHYPEETLKLALDGGAKFVRLDFFSDAVIAEGKPIKIDPLKITEYQKKIGAENIYLLTDIQVKYSEMIDKKISIGSSAKTAESKGSQGVIVTSTKSGVPPDTKKVADAKKAVTQKIPVIIGSGFSQEKAKELLDYADAVIVGTSISEKTGGPLVPSKVKSLVAEVNKVRSKIKN